ACRELWDKTNFYNAGPYTPWKFKKDGNPPSLIYPGFTGGPNWGGTAVDTKLNYIFVNSKDAPATGWIQKNSKYEPGIDVAKEFQSRRENGPELTARVRMENGRTAETGPCGKPPWAGLVGFNGNPGDLAWQVRLGLKKRFRPVSRMLDRLE